MNLPQFTHYFYLNENDEFDEVKKLWRYYEGNKEENTRFPYLKEEKYVVEVRRTNQKLTTLLYNCREESFLILSDINCIFGINTNDYNEIVDLIKHKKMIVRFVCPDYTKLDFFDRFNVNMLDAMHKMCKARPIEPENKTHKTNREIKEPRKNAPIYSKYDKLIEYNKVFTELDIKIMRQNRRASFSFDTIARKFNCTVDTVKYFTKDIKVKKELVRIKPHQNLSMNNLELILESESEISLVFQKFLGKYSFNSANTLCCGLLTFFSFAKEYLKKKVEKISEINDFFLIKEYFDYRKENFSEASVINSHNFISMFLNHSLHENYISTNYASKIKRLNIDRSVVKTKDVNKDDLCTIIKYIIASYSTLSKELEPTPLFKYMRNDIAILILIYTGMRVEEVASLKKDNIVVEDGTVFIKTNGKYNKIISHDLPENIAKMLEQYVKIYKPNHSGESFLFTRKITSDDPISRNYINCSVKAICNQAGIDASKITPHSFRTTFAVNAIANGMPIQELQRRMAHSDIKQTLAYARIFESKSKNKYHDPVLLEIEKNLAETKHNLDDVNPKIHIKQGAVNANSKRRSVFRKIASHEVAGGQG